MTEQHREHAPQHHIETLTFHPELAFAVEAAIAVGDRIYASWREGLEISTKADDTLVSQAEIETNTWFNQQVKATYGDADEVRGEEVPLAATATAAPGEAQRIWTIDTGDGSGELAATYRDRNTGDPINPTRSQPANADPELILEHERTTCTGIGLIKDNQLWLGVAYNPFQRRLVVADRQLGGTFVLAPGDIDGTNAQAVRANVNEEAFFLSAKEWDHATWSGGAIDASRLPELLGRPAANHYSAIDQAVEVALGNSACALFAGDTAHDIIPSLAIVRFAGGLACEANSGRAINIDELPDVLPAGIVYTDRVNHYVFRDALQRIADNR
jgi:3'-phosphoadenosine 5'-phosphosulfate (PAPS) 3'-phosphatase